MKNAYTFLSHYINAKHSVTKEILPKLLEGRVFSSHIRRLEFSEVAYHAKWSSTSNENCGHEWWRSITWLANIYDLSTHNRHIDQKHFQEPGESLPVSVGNSNANEYIPCHKESTSHTQSDKQMMNPRRRDTIRYKNLDFNLGCYYMYMHIFIARRDSTYIVIVDMKHIFNLDKRDYVEFHT